MRGPALARLELQRGELDEVFGGGVLGAAPGASEHPSAVAAIAAAPSAVPHRHGRVDHSLDACRGGPDDLLDVNDGCQGGGIVLSLGSCSAGRASAADADDSRVGARRPAC